MCRSGTGELFSFPSIFNLERHINETQAHRNREKEIQEMKRKGIPLDFDEEEAEKLIEEIKTKKSTRRKRTKPTDTEETPLVVTENASKSGEEDQQPLDKLNDVTQNSSSNEISDDLTVPLSLKEENAQSSKDESQNEDDNDDGLHRVRLKVQSPSSDLIL